MKLEVDDTQLFIGLVHNPIGEDEWVQELEFSINYVVTPKASKEASVSEVCNFDRLSAAEAFLIQFCGQYKTFSIPTSDEQYCATAEHQDIAFEKYMHDLNDIVKLLKIPTTLEDLFALTPCPDVQGDDEAITFLENMLVEEVSA